MKPPAYRPRTRNDDAASPHHAGRELERAYFGRPDLGGFDRDGDDDAHDDPGPPAGRAWRRSPAPRGPNRAYLVVTTIGAWRGRPYFTLDDLLRAAYGPGPVHRERRRRAPAVLDLFVAAGLVVGPAGPPAAGPAAGRHQGVRYDRWMADAQAEVARPTRRAARTARREFARRQRLHI